LGTAPITTTTIAWPSGAPPRDVLVEANRDRYFVPPYVGHCGWLGVYLDVPVDWDAVDAIVGDAYHTTAGRPR